MERMYGITGQTLLLILKPREFFCVRIPPLIFCEKLVFFVFELGWLYDKLKNAN